MDMNSHIEYIFSRFLAVSVELFDLFAHPIGDGEEHVQMVRVQRRRFRVASDWWRMKVGPRDSRFRMAVPSH